MATNIEGATIKLQETALTSGNLCMKGWKFDVTASAPSKEFTKSLPFDIDAVAGEFCCHDAEHGDAISVIIGKDTTIGLVENSGG